MRISEFLAARWGEIAAVAEAADHAGYWILSDGGPELADHFERHEPDHVLADIAAKRAILAAHPIDDLGYCSNCWVDRHPLSVEAPCPTIRFLAAPFASHRDYREEWRPALEMDTRDDGLGIDTAKGNPRK